MVSTRRTAAAPAEPAQAVQETERANVAPATRGRTKRVRAPSAAKPAEPEVTITQATAVATATSTTSSAALTRSVRTVRTRSKQTAADASPLKSLDDGPNENASSGKTPAPKATPKPATLKTKRKYNASRYNNTSASATPEPETAQRESAQDDSNDDQGMFFTQSMPQISSTPPPSTLIASSQGAEHDSVSQNDSICPQIDSISPKIEPVSPKHAITEHVSADSHEVTTLHEQLSKAKEQIEALRYLLSVRNQEILHLNELLEQTLQTGQVKANPPTADIDSFGMTDKEPQDSKELRSDYNDGGLLEHILAAKRAPRTVQLDNDNESDQGMEASPQQPRQSLTQRESESSRNAAEVTPSRPISKPSSFFSRSYSAIKSKLGWSTPTPPEPSPAVPSTTSAPPPDTFTEVLSAPPTPVGERRKTRPRKNKQNPMLKLLTRGVEPSDMAKAEEWAKNTIPTLKNYPDFAAKRKRLETPVLVQDLEHLPASKPWESGFGDPLGDMDDEDVVPVWAVVLEIFTEEEEPKRKKTKASHEVSMDVDDTLSINDMADQRLHDSHGHSASQLDFHPRRSVEPSPMFGTPSPHQRGSNVFGELHGHDAATELQTNDRETLHEATKDVVHNHNPSQGSFGLDYGSDDEDSTILEETSDADASASPLWTQAPPPAPVPAHAPLPGGSPAGTPAVVSDMPSPPAEQPVDEVERQRQKLMKHTPAKPSRLREAFVPSPSVLSDAGNQSLFLGTPVAAAGLYNFDFDDMPEAEEIELTADEWAGLQAITNSADWRAATASAWPDPIMEYGSEEEDLSPL
jgi:hypothetical protein